jgi:hypothetical protein
MLLAGVKCFQLTFQSVVIGNRYSSEPERGGPLDEIGRSAHPV